MKWTNNHTLISIVIIVILDGVVIHGLSRDMVKEQEKIYYKHTMARDEEHEMCWNTLGMTVSEISKIQSSLWEIDRNPSHWHRYSDGKAIYKND